MVERPFTFVKFAYRLVRWQISGGTQEPVVPHDKASGTYKIH